MNEIQELIDIINEFSTDLKSGKFIKDIAVEAANQVYDDVNEIFDTCVDKYYEDYDPIYYHRKKALYKTYKIKKNATSISWDFGAHLMPDVHRADTNYIYNYMYVKGYHGGPTYRVWPYFNEESFYPTKKSNPSAYKRTDTELDKYISSKSSITGTGLKDVRDDAFNIVSWRYRIFSI